MVDFNTNVGFSPLEQLRERQESVFERLSSGRRINDASDGAAAQQIIDRLTSNVEGNRQSIANAFDGVSLAQVAEGGLSGINDSVQRIRELSIQAGSGILTDADRSAIQAEVAQLQEGIVDTINSTEFAGQSLLSSDSEINFQVGANPGQTISVGTQDFEAALDGILNVDLSTAEGAQNALAEADAAQDLVGAAQSELGATQNQFESAARNLATADVNAAAARSRIQDTDFAQATAESIALGVRTDAAIAIQAQANQQEGQVLALLGQ
ncbi:flagellin [Alteromonadaceae bacterium M269]|nr:flagellin [Alteromonadaceae bacterium M269]